MVGKDDELGDIDDESLARVKLISEKKRLLEETADQVRQEIKSSFDRLVESLRGREKQLLRQVEAVHRQQLSLVQSNSELLPAASSTILSVDLNGEKELAEQLANFGKIELSNSIAVNAEPYKAEEYIEADEDYVSFDKSLKSEAEEFDVSSVIRKTKRDSYGNPARNISINLNCTSCDPCKFQASPSFSAIVTTKKLDTPDTPRASTSSSGSNSSDKSPFNESQDESSASAEVESPVTSAKEIYSENMFFEDTRERSDSGIQEGCLETPESSDDSEKPTEIMKGQDMIIKDVESTEHPIQVQQWLQQILVETETEPTIHEIGHLLRIPERRLYHDFPVET